jgi:hypothetical protein
MEFSSDALMVIESVSVVFDPSGLRKSVVHSVPSCARPSASACDASRTRAGRDRTRFPRNRFGGTREYLLQHLGSGRFRSFLQLVEARLEEPLIDFLCS